MYAVGCTHFQYCVVCPDVFRDCLAVLYNILCDYYGRSVHVVPCCALNHVVKQLIAAAACSAASNALLLAAAAVCALKRQKLVRVPRFTLLLLLCQTLRACYTQQAKPSVWSGFKVAAVMLLLIQVLYLCDCSVNTVCHCLLMAFLALFRCDRCQWRACASPNSEK